MSRSRTRTPPPVPLVAGERGRERDTDDVGSVLDGGRAEHERDHLRLQRGDVDCELPPVEGVGELLRAMEQPQPLRTVNDVARLDVRVDVIEMSLSVTYGVVACDHVAVLVHLRDPNEAAPNETPQTEATIDPPLGSRWSCEYRTAPVDENACLEAGVPLCDNELLCSVGSRVVRAIYELGDGRRVGLRDEDLHRAGCEGPAPALLPEPARRPEPPPCTRSRERRACRW